MAIHRPYQDANADQIYNLLFCDEPELFGNWNGGEYKPLFASNLDEKRVRAFAEDPAQDSRIRAFAFNKLRTAGRTVPRGVHLGTIIEAPLERGLDTLAAYVDGRIRYINATGKLVILEHEPPQLTPQRKAFMNASQGILSKIGPTTRDRPAPPSRGNVRMTFVASDGLYFGEGAFNEISRDNLGGPVLKSANDLLTAVVDFTLAQPR